MNRAVLDCPKGVPMRSHPKTSRNEVRNLHPRSEWTDGDHLRHCKFDGIMDDKSPRQVVKEHAGED
jgi:hypothetical protein